MDFKDLNIKEEIIDILKKSGITKPTPVQEECIGIITVSYTHLTLPTIRLV